MGFRSINRLQFGLDPKKGNKNKNIISRIKSDESGGRDHAEGRCHTKRVHCKQKIPSIQKG